MSATVVSALLALASVAAFIAAITLAATAVIPFWQGMPLVVSAGSLSGLSVFVGRPSLVRAVIGLAVGLAVGFVTYLGMVLATLSWWEA